MMCYFADRLLDKNDVEAADLVLTDYAKDLSFPANDEQKHCGWPRKPLEKTLLNSTTVNPSAFAMRAAFVCYEPPLRLFDAIAQRLRGNVHHRPMDYEIFCTGLNILLGRVKLSNLLPVLRCLENLERDAANTEEVEFVANWLHENFVDALTESQVWFHVEDAAYFVDTCTSFPGADLDDM